MSSGPVLHLTLTCKCGSLLEVTHKAGAGGAISSWLRCPKCGESHSVAGEPLHLWVDGEAGERFRDRDGAVRFRLPARPHFHVSHYPDAIGPASTVLTFVTKQEALDYAWSRVDTDPTFESTSPWDDEPLPGLQVRDIQDVGVYTFRRTPEDRSAIGIAACERKCTVTPLTEQGGEE